MLQEGWAPSSFTSSRSNPAQRKQQAVEDFLDEDELEERKKRGMVLTVSKDLEGVELHMNIAIKALLQVTSTAQSACQLSSNHSMFCQLCSCSATINV